MNFSVIMIINILSLNVNPISKVLHVSNLWQIFKSRLTLNCKPRTCDHRRLCPAHCSRQTVSQPVPRLTLLSFLDVFTHVSRSQTSTKCFMDSEVFPTPNFCLCHPNSLISCINIKQLFICHYQKIFVQHKSDPLACLHKTPHCPPVAFRISSPTPYCRNGVGFIYLLVKFICFFIDWSQLIICPSVSPSIHPPIVHSPLSLCIFQLHSIPCPPPPLAVGPLCALSSRGVPGALPLCGTPDPQTHPHGNACTDLCGFWIYIHLSPQSVSSKRLKGHVQLHGVQQVTGAP